jgi:hypothetical protein
MSQSWFYQHLGKTFGPVISEKLKELARQGSLDRDDLLWPEGGDPKDACPASAALDYASLPLVSFPTPDWLEDIAKVENKGPIPVPAPTEGPPTWLEDVRLWFGLELYADAKDNQPTSTTVLQTGGVPDWLEGWLTPEEPKSSKTQAAGTVPVSESPKKPANSPDLPVAMPVPLAVPVTPAKSTAPQRMSQATFLEKLAAKGKAPEAVPQAVPVAKPVEKTSPRRRQQDQLAEEAFHQTGFDLTTGQILDQDKFRKWQKASNAAQPAVSNETIFEVFRKARLAIENWVDEDCNLPLVMAGDLGAIKKNGPLLAIFERYQKYGLSLKEKLTHHLEFMVENRRKYYAARLRQGGQG